MRVYIESTIPSYVVARPARDLLQAARLFETTRSVPLVRATDEVKELAAKILASGLLPTTAGSDATHIALRQRL